MLVQLTFQTYTFVTSDIFISKQYLSGSVWKAQAAHWKCVQATFMDSEVVLDSAAPKWVCRAPMLKRTLAISKSMSSIW